MFAGICRFLETDDANRRGLSNRQKVFRLVIHEGDLRQVRNADGMREGQYSAQFILPPAAVYMITKERRKNPEPFSYHCGGIAADNGKQDTLRFKRLQEVRPSGDQLPAALVIDGHPLEIETHGAR